VLVTLTFCWPRIRLHPVREERWSFSCRPANPSHQLQSFFPCSLHRCRKHRPRPALAAMYEGTSPFNTLYGSVVGLRRIADDCACTRGAHHKAPCTLPSCCASSAFVIFPNLLPLTASFITFKPCGWSRPHLSNEHTIHSQVVLIHLAFVPKYADVRPEGIIAMYLLAQD